MIAHFAGFAREQLMSGEYCWLDMHSGHENCVFICKEKSAFLTGAEYIFYCCVFIRDTIGFEIGRNAHKKFIF